MAIDNTSVLCVHVTKIDKEKDALGLPVCGFRLHGFNQPRVGGGSVAVLNMLGGVSLYSLYNITTRQHLG